MPDTYTSQFSGEEIDSAVRAAQIISGASTPAELRKKLEIRGDTIPVSATDPTPVSEALTASGGGVNPNLLDNWYFGRPVNQRGKTEYTENWKYGIDRWLCAGDGKVTIADGHCVFYGAVDQGLSVQMSDILGCTMTASLLLADGTLLTGTAVNTDNSIDIPFVSNVDGMYLSLNATDLSGHRRFRTYSAPERAVLAAKLELGSAQTLAHKEGDKWMLNEIPDFGEQLRRCQRYFQRHHIDTDTFLPAVMYQGELDRAHFNIPLHGKMRTKPTARFDGSGRYVTAAFSQFLNTSIHLDSMGTTEDLAAITVFFNGISAATSGWVDSIGDIDFSADL